MAKHNTVMSILDRKHGVDTAVIVIDPYYIHDAAKDWGVVGKFITTHVASTDWATLWDWTPEGRVRAGENGSPFQTASGKWSTDRELLEGMSFGRHGIFKPGEWLTDLRTDGYIVIEVI